MTRLLVVNAQISIYGKSERRQTRKKRLRFVDKFDIPRRVVVVHLLDGCNGVFDWFTQLYTARVDRADHIRKDIRYGCTVILLIWLADVYAEA